MKELIKWLIYFGLDAIIQLVCTVLMLRYLDAMTSTTQLLFLTVFSGPVNGAVSFFIILQGLNVQTCGYDSCPQCIKSEVIRNIVIISTIRVIFVVGAIIGLSVEGYTQKATFIDPAVCSIIVAVLALLYTGVLMKKMENRRIA